MQAEIQAIRGMSDVTPQETPAWQYLEEQLRSLLSSYAYQEIRFPVLEHSQLFKRSIGELTDIVEKEMYTFEDRGGDSLSLRPEGTASCVRAARQHGLLHNQMQKLWYMGPMYRYERPQKGRFRQFHQLGVEAFGMAGAAIEAELIFLCADLWKRLGVDGIVRLELNNLGAAEDRANYGKALRTYLLDHREALDPDSQRRLERNVLRILDSKSAATQEVLAQAPAMTDYVSPQSAAAFDALLKILAAGGLDCRVNPSLVRGLDYYTGMVFEWQTDELGAQSAVCAGGRYDGLCRQLGNVDAPAVGFALGLERLLMLQEQAPGARPHTEPRADLFIAVIGEGLAEQALLMAQDIRRQLPKLRVLTHCGGGKYNSQLKKAYASGARCALVFEGEGKLEELKIRMLADKSESLTVSPYRGQDALDPKGESLTVSAEFAVSWLRDYFDGS